MKFSKSFDHHGKTKKEMFTKEFRRTKKPELPRRSVSNFDLDVFCYALEDGCVKVNCKREVWQRNVCQGYIYASKNPQEHPACRIFSVGEGRGCQLIVCGAPGQGPDGAIKFSCTIFFNFNRRIPEKKFPTVVTCKKKKGQKPASFCNLQVV